MVNQQKLSSEIIKLQHYDYHNRICIYNICNCIYQEIIESEIDNTQLNRGSYVNVYGKIVGIFATSIGPHFFIEKQIYHLKKKQFDFKVFDGENKENIFKFIMVGQDEIVLAYPKVLYKDFDAWSSEDFVDFFKNLSAMYLRESFYTYYTV